MKPKGPEHNARTHWRWRFLKQPFVTPLVKKYRVFEEIEGLLSCSQNSIIALCPETDESYPHHPTCNINLTSMPRSFKSSLVFRFIYILCQCIVALMRYTLSIPSHPPWFHHPNNIYLVKSTHFKHLIMQLPTASGHFIPFMNHILSVLVSDILSLCFPLLRENFTSIKNK